ncbi:MAG: 7TM domain-containing protein [Patescibacteria group bacterium]
MSLIVQQIIDFGVPQETLALILMLPVVATFIAFSRQIIGVRGLGIYITLIIAYAFVATKLKYGLIIFLLVIFAASLARILIRKTRLLYLPRMAMILTTVAFVIFLMFLLGSFLAIKGLQIISIFPILIMILMAERFVAVQIERGQRVAIFLTLETLILAVTSYLIINWLWLRGILLNYPLWSFLFFTLFNLLLGKWTGLRLTEYFRFRELMEYLETPKK